ncbi:MAG: peptidase T [Anaerovoracaceae bacterium]
MNVAERFLNYVMIDTQSREGSATVPSTAGQLRFAEYLVEELRQMKIEDVRLTEQGYVYGSVPSNTENKVPTIGFLAHVDTADSFPGPSDENPPVLVSNYDGGILMLPSGKLLDPKSDKNLKKAAGSTIITTNGNTLLGGDDKAGVAEIVTALETLLREDIPHGKIVFAFTPDEEIGTSMRQFDTSAFGAEYAYTVDGAGFGEIEYENFNGASAEICIHGISTHPGDAKGRLVNAALIGTELAQMLPENQRPECTEGYEGFYHLVHMEGNCETCKMFYLIREAETERYETMKQTLLNIAEGMNQKYGTGIVKVYIEDEYRNMAECILPCRHLIDHAAAAIRELGGRVQCGLIRGATDGADLSFMGIPCPNLGTGSYNHHSTSEFANVDEMNKCVQLILGIIMRYAGETVG